MAGDRLDALIASKYQDREGNEKSRYARCGALFPTKNGGWSLKLDFPIVVVPGQSDLVFFPPKPKEDVGF
jgi:hypothetical protein